MVILFNNWWNFIFYCVSRKSYIMSLVRALGYHQQMWAMRNGNYVKSTSSNCWRKYVHKMDSHISKATTSILVIFLRWPTLHALVDVLCILWRLKIYSDVCVLSPCISVLGWSSLRILVCGFGILVLFYQFQ